MTKAVANEDLQGRIEADLAFHRGMCELTGNETLVHTWQSRSSWRATSTLPMARSVPAYMIDIRIEPSRRRRNRHRRPRHCRTRGPHPPGMGRQQPGQLTDNRTCSQAPSFGASAQRWLLCPGATGRRHCRERDFQVARGGVLHPGRRRGGPPSGGQQQDLTLARDPRQAVRQLVAILGGPNCGGCLEFCLTFAPDWRSLSVGPHVAPNPRLAWACRLSGGRSGPLCGPRESSALVASSVSENFSLQRLLRSPPVDSTPQATTSLSLLDPLSLGAWRISNRSARGAERSLI